MASFIYFKFRSQISYSTITFDGHFVSVGEAKKLIAAKQGLPDTAAEELVLTNAQAGTEYRDDHEQVPKGTSITVRRVPAGTAARGRQRDLVGATHAPGGPSTAAAAASSSQPAAPAQPAGGGGHAQDDEFGGDPLQQQAQALKAQEEAARQAAAAAAAARTATTAAGSSRGGAAMGAAAAGGRGAGRGQRVPYPNYICPRCNTVGRHWESDCPTQGDPAYDVKRVRPLRGLPQNKIASNPEGDYMLADGSLGEIATNSDAYRAMGARMLGLPVEAAGGPGQQAGGAAALPGPALLALEGPQQQQQQQQPAIAPSQPTAVGMQSAAPLIGRPTTPQRAQPGTPQHMGSTTPPRAAPAGPQAGTTRVPSQPPPSPTPVPAGPQQPPQQQQQPQQQTGPQQLPQQQQQQQQAATQAPPHQPQQAPVGPPAASQPQQQQPPAAAGLFDDDEDVLQAATQQVKLHVPPTTAAVVPTSGAVASAPGPAAPAASTGAVSQKPPSPAPSLSEGEARVREERAAIPAELRKPVFASVNDFLDRLPLFVDQLPKAPVRVLVKAFGSGLPLTPTEFQQLKDTEQDAGTESQPNNSGLRPRTRADKEGASSRDRERERGRDRDRDRDGGNGRRGRRSRSRSRSRLRHSRERSRGRSRERSRSKGKSQRARHEEPSPATHVSRSTKGGAGEAKPSSKPTAATSPIKAKPKESSSARAKESSTTKARESSTAKPKASSTGNESSSKAKDGSKAAVAAVPAAKQAARTSKPAGLPTGGPKAGGASKTATAAPAKASLQHEESAVAAEHEQPVKLAGAGAAEPLIDQGRGTAGDQLQQQEEEAKQASGAAAGEEGSGDGPREVRAASDEHARCRLAHVLSCKRCCSMLHAIACCLCSLARWQVSVVVMFLACHCVAGRSILALSAQALASACCVALCVAQSQAARLQEVSFGHLSMRFGAQCMLHPVVPAIARVHHAGP